ncbi:hypothetical protein IFO70_25455 [Phormidium tenue FACHB-886]|nr:hypothetical protein [Phormidium tenue FACHB-886]
MNYRSLLSLALLLVVTGCGSTVTDQPVDTSRSSAPSESVAEVPSSVSQPLVKPSASETSPKPNLPTTGVPGTPRVTQPAPPKPELDVSSDASPLPLNPDSEEPISRGSGETNSGTAIGEIERDYGLTTPIASTGKVTVRDRIRYIDTDQLITPCPTDTAPYALAESTHYRIQICSGEYDPQLPKYYIGQAKDGSGELRITNSDLKEARQLIFKNDDYTYVLYQDGARPEETNAYLEVHEPDGESYAEALLYLYQ